MCKKDAKPSYYSCTLSYYRNNIATHNNFCSDACLNEFENIKVCQGCKYG